MRTALAAIASVFVLDQFQAGAEGCDPFSFGFQLGWEIMEKIDPIDTSEHSPLTRNCSKTHQDIRSTIGSNFRQSRNNKGLTIPDAAEMTGMSVNYILDLERGKRNPSIDVLESFAIALDVHYSELLRAPDC